MDTQLLYENIFLHTYSFSGPALFNTLGIVSRDIIIWRRIISEDSKSNQKQ